MISLKYLIIYIVKKKMPVSIEYMPAKRQGEYIMINKSLKGTIAALLICFSCASFCSCGNTDDANVISSDMETITETYNTFKKSKERTEKIDLYKSMKTVTKGKLSKSEQKQYSSFLIDMNDYFINDYNKTLIQVEMVINDQSELGKNQDKELVKEQYTILSDFEKQIEGDGIVTDEQLKDYKAKVADLTTRLQTIQKNSGIIDTDKAKKDIVTLPVVTGANYNYERKSTTTAKTTTTAVTTATTVDSKTTKATVTSTHSSSDSSQAHSSCEHSASPEPIVTEAPKQDTPPTQPSADPASEQNSPSEAQQPAEQGNVDDTQNQ